MAATDVTRQHAHDNGVANTARRLATETKAAFKTTEFFAYVLVLAGLLVAGVLTKAGQHHADRLVSHDVWLLATLLTIGYMVSRGLAKSGSRDPYTDNSGR